MKRSHRVAGSVMALTVVLTATLGADESARKAEASKPPWQRLLQGDDAKKAAQQQKQLTQLQEAGKFAEALKVAEVLAALRAKVQGVDHWQALDARFEVEAIRHVLRVKKEDQQHYGRVLGVKREADALVARGHYREAQPLFEQVLAMRRKVLGDEHPQTANGYNNVAYSLHGQGKYQEAEEGLRKALAIFRKVLGEEHPGTSNGYNNVAYSLNAQGKHQEAEENYGKALAIRRKVLGDEHPDTAQSYNNLAFTRQAQGKYQEAEQGFGKALAIRRKVLGDEHPDTANSYNNVAYNQKLQGKFQEAEEGFRKALAIRRKMLGDAHPQTATSYNNMASNLNAQGKYQEAEEGYAKALVIRRKVLGEEHPDTAVSYNNVAANLNAQGKYQEAEEDYAKALAICRKVLGDEHPQTANSYNNMAYNLQDQGKHKEAEEGLRKALVIRRKVLGEEHPDTGSSYNNVAGNLNARGKYQEAETFFHQAAESFSKARLHSAATGLQRAAFASKYSPLLLLAAVLARNGKCDDAWQRFEESLARGTWDDLTARLRRPQAQRDKQAQLIAGIDRLQKLIERASVPKPTAKQTEQREQWLTRLRQAYDELDTFTRQLEKQYGPIAGQVFAGPQIQNALSTDAAFLAWLDIPGQPKANDLNGEHWAILLRSRGAPVWVRLPGSGDNNAWSDADTQLPIKLRTALQSSRGDWQPLAERLRRQRLQPLAEHLKGVHHLIVLPSTALAGVPLEVIADGYTVSYAHSASMYAYLRQQKAPSGKGLFALADPVFETPTLAEKPQSLPPGGVLLTVVVPGSNAAKAGMRLNDVLLRYNDTKLTGPADFKPLPPSDDRDKNVQVVVWREGQTLEKPLSVRPGKLGIVLADKPAPEALIEQRRLDRRLASRSGDDGEWKRLPGTRFEVAALQQLFGNDSSRVLLNSESSEQRLNELAQSGQLGKYRYLHLATHGEVNDTFPLRSAVILARDHLPDVKQRTDLLLAGQPIVDGRLTAEEVLRRWNLHCDLVTLSACQTALGKYERGEGFVGFSQALVLCGSRSVCLSLWKVDDTATALLMERFYQNLLGKRGGLKAPMSKAAALAEAKTWLRTLPREEAVKQAATLSQGVARGKGRPLQPLLVTPAAPIGAAKEDRPFAHPYYWAAFVLVGHAD